MPEVKWRLTSSFPKSLDTLYGGSELFAKLIGEMSDNKFQIRAFAAGEIVPGLQVADAVQNGTVEAGQTAAYYYFGKHPNFVFETGLPFSMNQRQYYAWLEFGGGHELINDFYKEYNFRSFTFGGTGCQMGGWFRKEIKSMDDMKGLKFRVGGFAGLILTRLGVVPQQKGVVAAGDVEQAAAIELDDAGRQRPQEGAVVGDEEQGDAGAQQVLLEPADRLDVEVVGRLVEEQQVGLAGKRAGEQHPPFHPAGEVDEGRVRLQLEAGQHLLDALLQRPAAGGVEGVLHLEQLPRVQRRRRRTAAAR
jgi:hypothetical protein